MKIKVIILFALCLSSLNADYYLQSSTREPSKIDKMDKAVVGDMENIPQDLSYYAAKIKPIDYGKQKAQDDEYNKKYFNPWSIEALDINSRDFGWEARFVKSKPIYREDRTQYGAEYYDYWIYNSAMWKYNTVKAKAITTKRVDLKSLPMSDAYYRDPSQTGEGFPFDYNQNSSYSINMPLFVSHYSVDGNWAFVHGAYAFGWVEKKDIALVDDNFITKFKNGNYAITIEDNLRLKNENKPISLVKLGTIFPYDTDGYMFATKDANGMAVLQKAHPSKAEMIAKKPVAFTPENIAKIATAFVNEPYGWGESCETRDCSALTRDFFAPFGIFLRRNSSQQAGDGTRISLAGLNKEEKKAKILANAVPFRSMLFVPGHIVLYIGEYNNEPIVMHAYWGIRQKDYKKLITGRTIITTTEPGKEMENIRPESQLIETLKEIINF